MDDPIVVLKDLYARFNARDIDGVMRVLAEDVAWANGMDGGHVEGREAVRAYWTRQWSMVDPHVEPVAFATLPDDRIVAQVVQTVRDLDGNPIGEASHGLRDKTIGHRFQFRDGLVARFDIEDAAER